MAVTGPYIRPADLSVALEILTAEPDRRIVAGGTDHYPARVQPMPEDRILDITGITGLRGISVKDGMARIGATTTWSDIRNAVNLPPAFDGLKAAAAEVGGRQIQNRGTLAGNLCNASPAADGIPPLLSLDAQVVLNGLSGARRLPLSDFLTGYRKTARAAGELLTAVEVPLPQSADRGGFLKLGARHYLVISIAMVAAVLKPDASGRIAQAAVSVGACGPVACRLPDLEAALVGADLADDLGERVTDDHLTVLSPIDDPRASAAYRRDAAATLVRRLLTDLSAGYGAKEAA